jgi:hypothetical protein
MRVLVLKVFACLAKRAGISNVMLLEAANRVRRGLIGADLGAD